MDVGLWPGPLATAHDGPVPTARYQGPRSVADAQKPAASAGLLPARATAEPALRTQLRQQPGSGLWLTAGYRIPDPGLCPPLYGLQTHGLAAGRSGTTDSAPQQPGPAPADCISRQGPPPRQRRQ